MQLIRFNFLITRERNEIDVIIGEYLKKWSEIRGRRGLNLLMFELISLVIGSFAVNQFTLYLYILRGNREIMFNYRVIIRKLRFI